MRKVRRYRTLFCLVSLLILLLRVSPVSAYSRYFGKTTYEDGTEHDSSGGNLIMGSVYTLNETGTITGMSAYIHLVGGTQSLTRCMIYNETDFSLLGYTNEVYVSTTAQWVNYTMATSTILTAANYTLVFWASNSTWYKHSDYGIGTQRYNSSVTYNSSVAAIPDPFLPSNSSYEISIYASYSTTSPPTYSNISVSSNQTGADAVYSCLWNDDDNVSTVIFSDNSTGAWQNTTVSASWINTTAAWGNITKSLPLKNYVVQYRWYCNDTSDSWNSTNIQTLTLEGEIIPLIPIMALVGLFGMFGTLIIPPVTVWRIKRHEELREVLIQALIFESLFLGMFASWLSSV